MSYYCMLQSGIVSSGNSLDFTKDELALFEAHGVAVKEMEAAAIAWAAHLHGTPTFALKAITDIVDGAPATRSELAVRQHLQSADVTRGASELSVGHVRTLTWCSRAASVSMSLAAAHCNMSILPNLASGQQHQCQACGARQRPLLIHTLDRRAEADT